MVVMVVMVAMLAMLVMLVVLAGKKGGKGQRASGYVPVPLVHGGAEVHGRRLPKEVRRGFGWTRRSEWVPPQPESTLYQDIPKHCRKRTVFGSTPIRRTHSMSA